MLRVNQLEGFGAAGNLGPPVMAFQAHTTNAGASASYSFTSQAIGAEDNSRCVVVAVIGRAGGALDVSSVTVGGISATLARAGGGVELPVELWIARVPTGTTATIDVTFTGTSNFCAIGVWSVTNIDSLTPTDTAASSIGSILIDVEAVGIIVAVSSSLNGATSTWTNATERYDAAIGGVGSSGADYQAMAGAESNRSITCASADTNEFTVAASFR
jgi:hypothetical protein